MFGFIMAAVVACLPTQQIHTQLADTYHENRVMAGLNNAGAIIELWASVDGSWTVLLTLPDGMSCVMDTGHDYIAFPIEPEGMNS
ncbi:hypothetical protein [Paracoccus alkanivorans]|uniref:Uncharacterized protein n=1 Tax=Paracoccus alkanivorans TaxID=2116655 RepID=A0A3M0MIZ4_9RHOB|nr:hypothetical protein [Paracoccus alkanivorans]RMC37579.1 hypothetical protein C9E81_02175 [Paracoccus alkanivorans]